MILKFRELHTDDERLQKWLDFFTNANEDNLVNRVMTGPKQEGIGGFYTNTKMIDMCRINEECVLDDGTVVTSNEDEVAYLIHEFGHNYHFCVNDGEFTCDDGLPALDRLKFESFCGDKAVRLYVELEAWNLSNTWNFLFRLGKQEVIDKVNSKNMECVTGKEVPEGQDAYEFYLEYCRNYWKEHRK